MRCAIGLILYASGGVASGLAILVVLPVLTLTVLAGRRDALLIAAVAALAVLVQQVFVGVTDAAPATDYVTAGFFGAMVFLVALAMWPVANRLRESEALVRRREVDLANMAQLSQYIVQHLRESILVVDAQDRIRLINESAAQILGDTQAYPDALIGEASPRLLFLLEAWRQNTGSVGGVLPADQTFVAADGARVIRAHFAPLGTTSPGAGADFSRGHQPAGAKGSAVQARGPGTAERQHRTRDQESGRRHEPRRAAARRITRPYGR